MNGGQRQSLTPAKEVAEGKHDAHFPVDIYQTGSGTSTNTNANEVIANVANQRLGLGRRRQGQGRRRSSERPCQHGAVVERHVSQRRCTSPRCMAISKDLIPALERLHADLSAKAAQWDNIVKIGRTHLMDATPIRVGQVFSGYAAQAQYAVDARRAGP